MCGGNNRRPTWKSQKKVQDQENIKYKKEPWKNCLCPSMTGKFHDTSSQTLGPYFDILVTVFSLLLWSFLNIIHEWSFWQIRQNKWKQVLTISDLLHHWEPVQVHLYEEFRWNKHCRTSYWSQTTRQPHSQMLLILTSAGLNNSRTQTGNLRIPSVILEFKSLKLFSVAGVTHSENVRGWIKMSSSSPLPDDPAPC